MTEQQKIASAKFSAIISQIKQIIRENKSFKLSPENQRKINLVIGKKK